MPFLRSFSSCFFCLRRLRFDVRCFLGFSALLLFSTFSDFSSFSTFMSSSVFVVTMGFLLIIGVDSVATESVSAPITITSGFLPLGRNGFCGRYSGLASGSGASARPLNTSLSSINPLYLPIFFAVAPPFLRASMLLRKYPSYAFVYLSTNSRASSQQRTALPYSSSAA